MNIKINDIVDFYFDGDPIPKNGIICEINGDHIWVRVLHGELHNQELIVQRDNIIDDMYDEYGPSEERIYSWSSGD